MKKIDFHIHTKRSISDKEFEFDIEKLKEYVDVAKLDAIAITNHNLFDKKQFKEIKEELEIKVFPGVEVDLENGHVLLITDVGNEDEIILWHKEIHCHMIYFKLSFLIYPIF